MTPWYRERAIATSAFACAAAAILLGVTITRAMAEPPSEPVDATRTPEVALRGIEQASLPEGALDEVVDHDPFNPERRRPSVAFALPGAGGASAPAEAVSAPVAALRLLGTVLSGGDEAFVMVQLGAEPPRIVRVRGQVGGYTLRKIEPGRAVFLSPDGETVDLRVSKSGS